MKHFRKQLCALLAAALILCCGVTAFGTSVKVNSDAARLYKSASSSSDSASERTASRSSQRIRVFGGR